MISICYACAENFNCWFGEFLGNKHGRGGQGSHARRDDALILMGRKTSVFGTADRGRHQENLGAREGRSN